MSRLFAERSALAAFALWSASLAAQETRVGEEGFDSPPASLEQMDWLVGQWVGDGIGGAPAMESWLPPTGATMVGTFVQQTAEGEIQFTEHLYLLEETGSLLLRLKHFNADLTGWEEKDDMLTFRLVAIEPCVAYFNALTLRCADPDAPGEGLVAAVRMKSDKSEPQELVFRFERMQRPAEPAHSGSCAGAYTTIDMNECYAALLVKADAQRGDYLKAALAQHADRPALIAKIASSDAAFTGYRDAECGAVYEDWKDGTIRGIMSLTCRIEMTDRRTHTIWENWLTYPDTTPPIRPEPGPTR